MGDPGSIRGSGKSLGDGMASAPVFLPGDSHGQRSLAGYSPWVHKESNITEQLTLSLLGEKACVALHKI